MLHVQCPSILSGSPPRYLQSQVIRSIGAFAKLKTKESDINFRSVLKISITNAKDVDARLCGTTAQYKTTTSTQPCTLLTPILPRSHRRPRPNRLPCSPFACSALPPTQMLDRPLLRQGPQQQSPPSAFAQRRGRRSWEVCRWRRRSATLVSRVRRECAREGQTFLSELNPPPWIAARRFARAGGGAEAGDRAGAAASSS